MGVPLPGRNLSQDFDVDAAHDPSVLQPVDVDVGGSGSSSSGSSGSGSSGSSGVVALAAEPATPSGRRGPVDPLAARASVDKPRRRPLAPPHVGDDHGVPSGVEDDPGAASPSRTQGVPMVSQPSPLWSAELAASELGTVAMDGDGAASGDSHRQRGPAGATVVDGGGPHADVGVGDAAAVRSGVDGSGGDGSEQPADVAAVLPTLVAAEASATAHTTAGASAGAIVSTPPASPAAATGASASASASASTRTSADPVDEADVVVDLLASTASAGGDTRSGSAVVSGAGVGGTAPGEDLLADATPPLGVVHVDLDTDVGATSPGLLSPSVLSPLLGHSDGGSRGVGAAAASGAHDTAGAGSVIASAIAADGTSPGQSTRHRRHHHRHHHRNKPALPPSGFAQVSADEFQPLSPSAL